MCSMQMCMRVRDRRGDARRRESRARQVAREAHHATSHSTTQPRSVVGAEAHGTGSWSRPVAAAAARLEGLRSEWGSRSPRGQKFSQCFHGGFGARASSAKFSRWCENTCKRQQVFTFQALITSCSKTHVPTGDWLIVERGPACGAVARSGLKQTRPPRRSWGKGPAHTQHKPNQTKLNS